MKTVEKVLLAKREDNKFLILYENIHTTDFEFTEKPELAKRIKPWDETEYDNPKPASYYFENSHRAREYWLKGCKMVPYEITTIITAKEL